MPENRPRNTSRPPVRRKKKRYNPFRLSLVLMFYIVSIVVSFLFYAANFDISSKPSADYESLNSSGTEDASVTEADAEDSDFTDENKDTVTDTGETEPEISAGGNPVPESKRMPDEYLKSCMFIGDSITTGFSVYGFVPSEYVFADVGLRIDKIEETKIKNPKYSEPVNVLAAIENEKPENVYVLLGSNGIAWYNNDTMLEKYGEFIDDIKTRLQNSKIYIISITPVGSILENKNSIGEGKVLNSEIDQFNSKLLALSNEKNVNYLDVNSVLKDENGKLPDDVTRDGMHFDKATYQKVIDYILTHTVK